MWRQHFFEPMKKPWVDALLYFVEQDRIESEHYSHVYSQIKAVVGIFFVMHVDKKEPTQLYRDEFEQMFLAQTISYYTSFVQEKMHLFSIREWIFKLNVQMREEERRVRHYLDMSTLPRVCTANLV